MHFGDAGEWATGHATRVFSLKGLKGHFEPYCASPRLSHLEKVCNKRRLKGDTPRLGVLLSGHSTFWR